MAPLSVVFTGPLVRAAALALASTCLVACMSDQASALTAKDSGTAAGVKCTAPAPIPDIWKLEPMLTKQGAITAEMSKEQEEAVIREYIRRKNQAFLNCKEKKSTP